MSTKTKIITVIVALLIVATILYFVFRKKKVNDQLPPIVNQPTGGTASSGPQLKPAVFPLELNMQGEYVSALQRSLNKIQPTNPIKVDGVFGDQTKRKLLLTVDTTLSRLPMSSANWTEIIKRGNALN